MNFVGMDVCVRTEPYGSDHRTIASGIVVAQTEDGSTVTVEYETDQGKQTRSGVTVEMAEYDGRGGDDHFEMTTAWWYST